MAAAKTSTKKTTTSKSTINGKPGTTDYVNQKFGPKALALINKYNLQTDESYKKLISSFERIDSLPKNDPRKPNLVDLWEGEFNRIFKHFWENYAIGQKRKDNGVSGWKERLDVKPAAMSPDQKRKDLMTKLTPGNVSTNRNTKEEILSRAGYVSQVKTEQFNFTAVPRTGQNIYEIENLLSAAEEKGMGEPESILQNGFGVASKVESTIDETPSNEKMSIDEETELMTSQAVPDPNLLDFINEGKVSNESSNESSNETQKQEMNNTNNNDNLGYVARENMSREEFNRANNIYFDESQNSNEDDNLAALELGTEFFQQHLTEDLIGQGHVEINEGLAKREYNAKDEIVAPEKRNIVSKEGFEISVNPEKTDLSGKVLYESKSSGSKKPYHEENPVGYYPMNYDAAKRPAMHDLMAAHQREGKALDEMTQKIEFLRELRNDRRHRINMMKIERANSYIVARARRLTEARELKRLKKREEFNLKAIEKAERLRRLQERQKLIELMKERQLKRNEEKRVATVLRLERERRLERDAKYRTEIASIDAQIRHEQEMIKRTELKMKAYFTKVHDDQLFDKSLKIAKETTPNYKSIEQKAEVLQQLEEQKRKDRVEKISRKFIKNIK
ncbi:hypothetical protein [Spiroplasma monobiae]|uniref:Uncharacterized protein n=1 Tax=Spiroplasma monobiae MQ-1 TaxID=1336748 RepID=A0A2K9LU02_SPISQ|nr:hypothetical protein [Spiroplasma monobiae]AUM62547.1 hypothetical protein SMONO_v1c02980 [Spiroplasma monobiae MQ-1]